ncbi:MAG: DUF1684 domain-containing protein [Candidatus Promineifilaceae bacterium]
MNKLQLAEWRHRVAELYAEVRAVPFGERESAWHHWRKTRDLLFWTHPLTPLNAEQMVSASAVQYFPYDPNWRKIGRIDHNTPNETVIIELPEGNLRMTRIAHVRFEHAEQTQTLGLYWIEGYGGGLFLPFGDQSNNKQTYGGGRYLYDGIKGADLGRIGDDIILDFNFSYNPSCGYNHQWVCPLAPFENRLQIAVEAGELDPQLYF